jgi:predicted HD phosphohydrolase
MKIRYYFSIFPMEALIASQLEPVHFGSYMATGTKKGSAEKIIFCELLHDFGDYFDWNYAHERCVPHPTGEPKNSLYLAVYRVLENIP